MSEMDRGESLHYASYLTMMRLPSRRPKGMFPLPIDGSIRSQGRVLGVMSLAEYGIQKLTLPSRLGVQIYLVKPNSIV